MIFEKLETPAGGRLQAAFDTQLRCLTLDSADSEILQKRAIPVIQLHLFCLYFFAPLDYQPNMRLIAMTLVSSALSCK